MLTESVSTRIFVNSTLCVLIFIHIVWNHVLVFLSSLNVSLSTVILFLCLTVCPTVCLLSPTCLLFSLNHVKSTRRAGEPVRRARSCSMFLIRAFYLLSTLYLLSNPKKSPLEIAIWVTLQFFQWRRMNHFYNKQW